MKSPRRPPAPFDIIHCRIYSNNRCFYCGKLFRSERSREHVFPEWLQNQFGLADQTLTLLNRTTIPYRRLKVPCCRICNNVHLSQLENRVKRHLFEQTVEEARVHLDQIFIWVTKILLAIVYAERLLPFSRRHPSGKPILPTRAVGLVSDDPFFHPEPHNPDALYLLWRGAYPWVDLPF